MLIKSLYCPCNNRSDNPIDHYARGVCPNPPVPLPLARGIVNSIQGDTVHRDLNITVTRCLTCPRQVAIEDTIPVVLDVRRHLSTYEGSVTHRDLQKNAPPGSYTEVEIPPQGQTPPTFLGVQIRGTIDFVTSDLTEIHDYKKHSETAQRLKYERGGADRELTAQLNMYRILLEKVTPAQIKRLIVWHGAMVSAKGPPAWFRIEMPFMTEEEIGKLKPHGGELTVQELVEEYHDFDERINVGGLDIESAVRQMALVGRKMWRGEKCRRYCAVKEKCDEIEGIVGSF